MVAVAAAVAVTKASLAALPQLGVGLGFRPAFAAELLQMPLEQSPVDFLEITVEHYLDPTPAKRAELERLRERFTLIPHGLNLSLGSAEGLDPAYLKKLAALIELIDPPWWSEHICFTRAAGIEIGHLAPLPFTQEALDVLCRNIAQVKGLIAQPLILENITYMLNLGGELSEGAFLAELLERSDCGLLLDLTNLHTNALNHGYQALELLQELPWQRIVQLHFAGGYFDQGRLIDSHSQPAPEEVWQLMASVLERTPVKGVILERDEQIPALSELRPELERARQLCQQSPPSRILG